MAGYFEPAGGPGRAALALDEVEIAILRSLAIQLLELIGPDGEEAEGADPFDALMKTDGPTEPPADPALARLFPDAYGGPDREEDEETRRLSAEFRRFTEEDLRARKRQDLLAVVRGLDAAGGGTGDAAGGGAVLTLEPEESRQWLGGLNDLRLAIATRLDISDDDGTEKLFALPDDDPDKPMIMAYFWLGGLQESLVETLLP
jgi:hypothetical protein